ncbi:MAG TPA: transposase [Candidatus Thermoplasmatota archaeon]|nr:transposase [Candidatus Thermoplasmatota archaeon]
MNFQAVGRTKYHLHVLGEVAPWYSLADVMQICNSITAKQLFKKSPDLEEELWGGHFWSEGGYIDTAGASHDVDTMGDYINKQGIFKLQNEAVSM